jgi:hypothetical protein
MIGLRLTPSALGLRWAASAPPFFLFALLAAIPAAGEAADRSCCIVKEVAAPPETHCARSAGETSESNAACKAPARRGAVAAPMADCCCGGDGAPIDGGRSGERGVVRSERDREGDAPIVVASSPAPFRSMPDRTPCVRVRGPSSPGEPRPSYLLFRSLLI